MILSNMKLMICVYVVAALVAFASGFYVGWRIPDRKKK